MDATHSECKSVPIDAACTGLKIDALTQPRLTAEWEYKLSLIEKNQVSRDEFMHEIREMTERMVASAKQYEGDSVPIVNPIHFHNRCPACGGEIVENYRRYACTILAVTSRFRNIRQGAPLRFMRLKSF